MGNLIVPGQTLAGGQGAGQLNQYYGLADVSQTTVTAASFANLCTAYTIPAGEPYAFSAYELSCSGQGVWGSTTQAITFEMYLGSGFGSLCAVGGSSLPASAAFSWKLLMTMTCSDGVQSWWADLAGTLQQNTVNDIPGTAANGTIPFCSVNSGVHNAVVSSPVTAVVQAKWGSTTGAPTITTYKTTFRKVA